MADAPEPGSIREGTVFELDVPAITVPDRFLATPPKEAKLARKRAYYATRGKLESEIVVDPDGVLQDGFTSYLIALENGLEKVPVRVGSPGRHVATCYYFLGLRRVECEVPFWLTHTAMPGEEAVVQLKNGKRIRVRIGRVRTEDQGRELPAMLGLAGDGRTEVLPWRRSP